MNQWNPISVPPNVSQRVVLLIKDINGIIGVEIVFWRSLFAKNGGGWNALGWMPAEELLDMPFGYDPNFGADRLCKCGHPYYRHFDTYDDMSPVGCKYCFYTPEDDPNIKYRKEIKLEVPEDLPRTGEVWETWYEANKDKYVRSICSGFELEDGQ